MNIAAFIILGVVIVCVQGTPRGAINKGRIVGGDIAEEGDVPSIVSIRVGSSHSCGGSLISTKWVLTAAHCAQGSSYSIQYGTLNISANPTDSSVIKIKNVIFHEKYDSSSIENDIAVMELETPANIKTKDLAKLPKQDEAAPGGSPVLLAGWGRLATGDIIPEQLQKVNITIVDIEECKKAHYNPVFDTNICAGVPQGGKGQCSGDSGGPLTLNGKVVGLVSWSVKPCTVKGYPGVFTRVASFRSWITKKTGI